LTAREFPTVADVDGDGHAEILAPASTGPSPQAFEGVRVWGGSAAGWAGARSIWNQHAYHITNIRDDGTVPHPPASPCDPPSVLPFNSFRVQRPALLPAPAFPDVTLAVLEAEGSEPRPCEPQVRLVLRVGNAGESAAGPFQVAVYDGDPLAGGRLLGTETVPGLPGDSFEELELVYPAGRFGPMALHAVGDDGQDVQECREENNTCGAPVEIQPSSTPEEPSPIDLQPSAPPLRVVKPAGHAGLLANWEDLGGPAGYRLYRGTLGDYYSHGSTGLCDLASPETGLPPETGSFYYLAVGTACDGLAESSYGRNWIGEERPDATAAGGRPCP
jgi:hypothetical protein